jgi:hypothetical protein
LGTVEEGAAVDFAVHVLVEEVQEFLGILGGRLPGGGVLFHARPFDVEDITGGRVTDGSRLSETFPV